MKNDILKEIKSNVESNFLQSIQLGNLIELWIEEQTSHGKGIIDIASADLSSRAMEVIQEIQECIYEEWEKEKKALDHSPEVN